MRVFVTGATGFVGSAITRELIGAGHQVVGLTRSEAGARALGEAGAEAHRGSLEDLESLRAGAAAADGVIHCAFEHNFADFLRICEQDRRAIEVLGGALRGSDRALVMTSVTGLGNGAAGEEATEERFDEEVPNPRKMSEMAVAALVEGGVNASVVRLPQVHDTVKQGLVTYAIAVAREKGVSAYVGDGQNRWPAAHVRDVARLYRLALEKRAAGARYHAVAEEGIPVRAIAETIGKGLKVPVVSIAPEQAGDHFGWFGMFAAMDLPASSAQTRARLGWQPTGPGLIADLEEMRWGS